MNTSLKYNEPTSKVGEKPSQLTQEIKLFNDNVVALQKLLDRLEGAIEEILSPSGPSVPVSTGLGEPSCKLHDAIKQPNNKLSELTVVLGNIIDRIQL